MLALQQALSRRDRELRRPSFPHKRERNAEFIAGAWIPAFAGMTVVGVAGVLPAAAPPLCAFTDAASRS